MNRALQPEMFLQAYEGIENNNELWNEIPVADSPLFNWEPASTYIQEPPYFDGMELVPRPIEPVKGARVLALLGDSVTTDHISPAGNISARSPAGRFLVENGVEQRDFNSYGSRRGNDRVMTRGTFANIRLKNLLVPGVEGGVTKDHLTGETTTIYDAAQHYRSAAIPGVVVAGIDYGMGSSRDWAAKGTLLLGVRAVLARSFERIHRSNLVGMGVLPLQFKEGESAQSLGITGDEAFDIPISDAVVPGQLMAVTLTSPDGSTREIEVVCRLDSAVEVGYFRHGGILPMMVRQFIDS
jgi:aconitate hydratase